MPRVGDGTLLALQVLQKQEHRSKAMALRNLFRSARGRMIPSADVANREGAPAYRLTPKHELAQLVSTSCVAGTFYASAEQHLADLLRLASLVEPDFVARAAVHARR